MATKRGYRAPRAIVTYNEDGAPIGIVETQREVAESFNVSYEVVRRKWSKSGMPRLPNGKYNLFDVWNWKRTRYRDPDVVNGSCNGHGDTAMDRRRLAEAIIAEEKAKAISRENRLADADIVQRHDVERFFANVFSTVRDQLQRIPAEMGPTFPAAQRADMAQHLTERLELVLTTLRAMDQEISEIGA